MNMLVSRGLFTIPAVVLMTGSAIADNADLTPKYQAGQTMTFVQKTVRTDGMKAPMGEQITNLDCTALWKAEVISSGEKGTEIALTMESVKAQVKQNAVGGEAKQDVEQSWDSSDPSAIDLNNPVLQAFRPLIGVRLLLQLDDKFQITTVGGAEALRPVPGVIQQYAYQMLSADGVKTRWGPVFAIHKGKSSVAKGDSWKEEVLGSPGALGRSRNTTTATLQSVAEGFATVTLTGSFEFLGAKDGEKPLAKVEDVKVEGTCLWDTKVGLCKSLEQKQKYAISASLQGFDTRRTTEATITTTRQ